MTESDHPGASNPEPQEVSNHYRQTEAQQARQTGSKRERETEPKRELRKILRAQRRALPQSQQAEAADAVAAHLAEWLRSLTPGTVAASVATDGELDPTPTVALLRAAGWRVVYPRVDAEAMTFHLVDGVAELLPGRWGLVEPAAAATMLAPSSLDLVLAPLVAFDREGNRLGRGKAYYDRAFAFLNESDRPRRPFMVGLAHDMQRVDDLSQGPHDVRLDAVVTPSGVVRQLPTA